MQLCHLFLLIAILFLASLAQTIDTTSRAFLEFEKPMTPSEGWSVVQDSPRPLLSTPRKFIMALKQQNKDILEEIFWQVSDPTSPKYGEYLSIDDLTAILAPKNETISLALSFLADHGITAYHMTKNRDFVTFTTTLETAETMFQTRFYQFQHTSGRKYTTSLGPYTVPIHLKEHLDFVTGIIGFPLAKDTRKTGSVKDGTVPITPKVLRQRYNVTDIGGKQPKNAMAVAEFQDQFFSPDDLKIFFNKYLPEYNTPQYYNVTRVVGPNTPGSPGVEAELDIQFIMGVAIGVPTWFWSNPAMDFWSDLTTWTSQMDDEPNLPPVHSISYGSQGNYPSTTYRDRLNTEFQKLGTRGASIIFASGDSGTGCNLCWNFDPSFPATSPYVTSVGATSFINNDIGPERATEAFSSGGGFSWHFPTQSYQSDAVEHYLKTASLPGSGFYNAKGRATPDVGALGVQFQVVVGGNVEGVAGTSASTPTFAGIVALLNEHQLANGKPTLGFLNPWIYQTFAKDPTAFWDVTVGDNQYLCCGLTGFECAEGWDPVTGVGTPNYPVLKTHLP